MDGKKAIERIKKMVSKCEYSTMRKVFYVALQCEGGATVKVENRDTIWRFFVNDKGTVKLLDIKHKKTAKNKSNKKRKVA
jgi:hypothetical protein